MLLSNIFEHREKLAAFIVNKWKFWENKILQYFHCHIKLVHVHNISIPSLYISPRTLQWNSYIIPIQSISVIDHVLTMVLPRLHIVLVYLKCVGNITILTCIVQVIYSWVSGQIVHTSVIPKHTGSGKK